MEKMPDISILVLDDEEGIREAMSWKLRELGPKAVHTMGDPREALELLASAAGASVGIAFVDYRMGLGKMNGVEFFTEAKKLRPTLQGIMCTSVRDRALIQESMRAGFGEHIDKPLRGDFSGLVLGAAQIAAAKYRVAIREAEMLAHSADMSRKLTEIDTEREELQRLVNVLRRQSEEQRQVTAGLLHDAANPLSLAKALIEFLEEEIHSDPDAARKTSEVLKRQLETSVAIMRKVMRAVAPNGNPALTRSYDAELRMLADQLHKLSQRPLEKRSIEFMSRVDIAGPTLALRANHLELLQVATNVIKNAAEASPPGAAIAVSYRGPVHHGSVMTLAEGSAAATGLAHITGGTWGLITVEDHGLGLTDFATKHLFHERISTKKEGTGHGLFSSARTVIASGGTIFAHSSQGVGARFTIALPAI